MREIPLTRGYVAIIDDSDYERVSEHKWRALSTNGGVYAAVKIEGKLVLMHRFILQAPISKHVDHIDHNELNNVRANLRLVTHNQNMQNKRIQKNNTSGVKGVSWHKSSGTWAARVAMDGKVYLAGHFHTLEEAAEAVRKKRLELHKEFACDK